MIEEAAAIRVAIDVMRVPSRVRRQRSQPLPKGVDVLLRIAAGDQDAEGEAAELTGQSPGVIREAATFFIEQILLSPGSDNYRILGACPDATNTQLRRNMVLLLKGMHPDVALGTKSVFARRVIGAWNAIKTPEKRAAYNAARQRQASHHALNGTKKDRGSKKPRPSKPANDRVPHRPGASALAIYRPGPEGLLRRVFRLLLTGVRT